MKEFNYKINEYSGIIDRIHMACSKFSCFYAIIVKASLSVAIILKAYYLHKPALQLYGCRAFKPSLNRFG